ncbi:thioredoxin domain-containing protein 9 homolog isoform X1 [Camellia sinensis]|uniref:thioredoxin domain-containing protein 9 homolog isoform X1 n=1 Tax=Camellia sinensis TaxID=4442 RepID=UPI00103664F9|nr:thioredoxin domain-containing protein 9 homolog isoform X1 [Camellia sinensis]
MDNSKVQEIIEKQVLTVAKAVEEKIDDEIHTLDRLDLDDINVLRECCHQQIKKMKEKQSRWIALSHGENSEIPAEKDIFSVVMDKHLSILSKQHIETRFVKIHAEKSPFLAEKLKIVVPPTLALIKSAKVDDYVVTRCMTRLSDEGLEVYFCRPTLAPPEEVPETIKWSSFVDQAISLRLCLFCEQFFYVLS